MVIRCAFALGPKSPNRARSDGLGRGSSAAECVGATQMASPPPRLSPCGVLLQEGRRRARSTDSRPRLLDTATCGRYLSSKGDKGTNGNHARTKRAGPGGGDRISRFLSAAADDTTQPGSGDPRVLEKPNTNRTGPVEVYKRDSGPPLPRAQVILSSLPGQAIIAITRLYQQLYSCCCSIACLLQSLFQNDPAIHFAGSCLFFIQPHPGNRVHTPRPA
jgi:hypothetical protein